MAQEEEGGSLDDDEGGPPEGDGAGDDETSHGGERGGPDQPNDECTIHDFELRRCGDDEEPSLFDRATERVREWYTNDPANKPTGIRDSRDQPSRPTDAVQGNDRAAQSPERARERSEGTFDRGSGGRNEGTRWRLEGTQYMDMFFFAASRGFHVTSTTGGTHNRNSLHPRGRAIDVRTWDHRGNDVDTFIDEARAHGLAVRDERTRPRGQAQWSGPHVHISSDERRRERTFGLQGRNNPALRLMDPSSNPDEPDAAPMNELP